MERMDLIGRVDMASQSNRQECGVVAANARLDKPPDCVRHGSACAGDRHADSRLLVNNTQQHGGTCQPMPETRQRCSKRWINGCAHALLVDHDVRGQHTTVRLIRKADAAELLRAQTGGGADRRGRLRYGPLTPAARSELDWLCARLDWPRDRRAGAQRLHPDHDWLQGLGVPPEVLTTYRPPRQREPVELVEAGRDVHDRPLWLTAAAANAWRRLSTTARADGITLLPVSAFRSAAYQHRLIARKRARGQSWEQILAVSALPGYSEHHLGTTLDLHAGDGPALEECFEHTQAFAWLQAHAGRHGFRLSYPRDNAHGITYEPWHWRFHGASGDSPGAA